MTSPQFMVADLATEILTSLHSTLDPVGAQVVDGFIADSDDIDRQPDGTPVPTAVFSMGDPGELRTGQVITGVLDSMEYVNFYLTLIAPDQAQLRSLHDLVRKALRGNVFPRCGEVRQVTGVGGSGGRAVPSLYAPARHVKSVGFTMSIGA